MLHAGCVAVPWDFNRLQMIDEWVFSHCPAGVRRSSKAISGLPIARYDARFPRVFISKVWWPEKRAAIARPWQRDRQIWNKSGGCKHNFYFPFYMGCHPSHWRTPSFFRMVIAPPTSNGNHNFPLGESFLGWQLWDPISMRTAEGWMGPHLAAV